MKGSTSLAVHSHHAGDLVGNKGMVVSNCSSSSSPARGHHRFVVSRTSGRASVLGGALAVVTKVPALGPRLPRSMQPVGGGGSAVPFPIARRGTSVFLRIAPPGVSGG